MKNTLNQVINNIAKYIANTNCSHLVFIFLQLIILEKYFFKKPLKTPSRTLKRLN